MPNREVRKPALTLRVWGLEDVTISKVRADKFGLTSLYPAHRSFGRKGNVCHISNSTRGSSCLVIRHGCRCPSRLRLTSELVSIEKVDFLGFWSLGCSCHSSWRLELFGGVD